MNAVRKVVSADMLTPIVDLPWKSKGLQVEMVISPVNSEEFKKAIRKRYGKRPKIEGKELVDDPFNLN